MHPSPCAVRLPRKHFFLGFVVLASAVLSGCGRDGEPAKLKIKSGNHKTGLPGKKLKQPLRVQVLRRKPVSDTSAVGVQRATGDSTPEAGSGSDVEMPAKASAEQREDG